jgi:hypothetical protein
MNGKREKKKMYHLFSLGPDLYWTQIRNERDVVLPPLTVWVGSRPSARRIWQLAACFFNLYSFFFVR